jgi:hypothetical protein
MGFDQELMAAIQARIVRAEFDRDHWRIAGNQEKYLEAYSLVDALGLELDQVRLRRAVQLRKAAQPPAPKADGS